MWETKHQQTACSEEEGAGSPGTAHGLPPREGDSSNWSALVSGHRGTDKRGADCRHHEMKLLLSSEKRELVPSLLLRLWWIWIHFPWSGSYRDRAAGL